jgi:hypothetical protein
MAGILAKTARALGACRQNTKPAQAIIIRRPELFERLILELENAPERAILLVVRESETETGE